MGSRLSHKRSVTRLEDLPNELFYDIFRHLNNDECYGSFAGLNARLHEILQLHCGSHLRIMINAATINTNTLSSPEFSHNLCSLTIDHLTENHIEQMRTLVNLKQLRILHIPEKLTYSLGQFLQSSKQIQHLSLPQSGLPDLQA